MPDNNFINTAISNPQVNRLLDLALSLYKSTRIDDILGQIAEGVRNLYGAEHVRLFAYNAVENEVYTRIHLRDISEELKFAVSEDSVAGYTAYHKDVVALDDVRDTANLSQYPRLRYDPRYEDRTGVRIRSIISAPMLENESNLIGIVQLINVNQPAATYSRSLPVLVYLAKLVATAVFHHDERQRRATKFDLLLQEGLVSPEEITRAIQVAREHEDDPIQGDPVKVLMDECSVPEAAMQASLSRYYLTNFLPYEEDRILPSDFLRGFNPDYLRKHFVVPISFEDKSLTVLAADPFQPDPIRELKQVFLATHCRVLVGFRRDILRYIDKVLGDDGKGGSTGTSEATSTRWQAHGGDEDASKVADSGATDIQEENILDDQAPLVIQVVNKLILDAFQHNVSDIHVEPGLSGQDTLIRFRKDGSCFEHTRIPASLTSSIISRIKVMSGLRLEEHRFPQSGKIRLKYGDSTIELRVEVTPTVGRKEDVVMRILAGGTFLTIDDLGFSETNRTMLMDMIAKPYGILLVVGPTGSGKTTTLHAVLHHLNSADKKIWTVEDPVEITQPGLRQVQVNFNIKPEAFDFAKAMRSFLRADPDIIMVGEMRDKETATIAVEASLTGHLVLSTLHTNSAPETITRLIEMGIDPINLADSLLGVLAQRLVRTLCKDCKREYVPEPAEIEALTVACGSEDAAACGMEGSVEQLYCPVGCEHCSNTGFRGRAGIHELLSATAAVKQAITSRQTVAAIREQALTEGMHTLKMDGIRRVIDGQTTLVEVLKVCID